MKRYLSLDIGDATIGIAVSDLHGLTAQGVEAIRRTELSADLDRLAQLVQEYEPTGFVAGLPRHEWRRGGALRHCPRLYGGSGGAISND